MPVAEVRPIFQPAMRQIATITNAFPCVVTTTFDHNYIDTDIIKIYLPMGFGMQELNGYQGDITVTGATTFVLNGIDSTNFSPLTDPNNGQVPQCLPAGEQNRTVYGAIRNTLPSRNRF